MSAALRRLVGGRTGDVALAFAVLTIVLAERLTTTVTPALFAASLLAPMPLLLRRTATLAAAAACLAISLVLVLAGLETESAAGAWLATLVLGYSAGRHARARLGVPELVLLVLANEALWGLAKGSIASDLFFPGIFCACAWAVGRWVRYDLRIAARVHEESALVLERAERDREAARAAERRRVAREMHDVIAHSVSVMVVQAGGARRILASDPARAVHAAALIEATGRDALAELRTLLGVIGVEPDQTAPPAPSLTRLGPLVERAEKAGLRVGLAVDGDLHSLPAGVDVAGYRIVQEALTNALRHAGPVAAAVYLRRDEGALAIDVTNAAPAPGHRALAGLTRPGGHGMMGMAERATLYGGELDAGPTPGGGFHVHARLTFSDHRIETTA